MKYNKGEVYSDNFKAFSVKGQVRFPPKFIEVSDLMSLSNLNNAFNIFTGSSHAILAGLLNYQNWFWMYVPVFWAIHILIFV